MTPLGWVLWFLATIGAAAGLLACATLALRVVAPCSRCGGLGRGYDGVRMETYRDELGHLYAVPRPPVERVCRACRGRGWRF